ncbi:hypothetical protein HanXRQr2_Chr15g0686541 [Helianthus annuus]|uniref:Uncharacterized protein n=1 Tax=Helianthus annuus TaxID=4232 RepID=A0A251S7E8_HELAN|nr:hypothetical protein HanXRQr2_Chr15g0686541 [Helianthus annuus]KAJ0830717.1 hypothetical protein HanPSC8_Chr15g0658601 [Helianthus annuus]
MNQKIITLKSEDLIKTSGGFRFSSFGFFTRNSRWRSKPIKTKKDWPKKSKYMEFG